MTDFAPQPLPDWRRAVLKIGSSLLAGDGGLDPVHARGLAAFIAAVGLSAGPSAVALIREYGLALPVVGLLVSFLPALVSLLVGWKLMKIDGRPARYRSEPARAAA